MGNKRIADCIQWSLCCLIVIWGLSVIPVRADNSITSGKCGEEVNWEFDAQTGILTISGSGAMWDFINDAEWFNYHECPWQELKESIRKVRFQGTVTVIGASAFSGCRYLTELEFCDSITEIYPFAFMSCPILSVELPPMLEYLGQQCFSGSRIQEVQIPDSVCFLDNAFSRCRELRYVYIGAPSGTYTYGSGLFSNCSKLECIDVSPDNIALKSIDGVLFSKDGNTLVQYPAGKSEQTYSIPESVTFLMRFSFWGAEGLATVIFPESLESIDDAVFDSNIENYVFRGNMPLFGDSDSLHIWNNPTAYYPRGNKTWGDFENLGFINDDGLYKVTWVPYGWENSSEGWRYVEYNGTMKKNAWLLTGGRWYHFDAQGLMQTGWQKINEKWYYFSASGAMQTGWQKVNGKWYYLNSSGAMQTGWQKVNGKWYYLNSSGAMQTGWQKINEKWYYFKNSGAMAANEWCGGWWLNANGSWTYPYKASWKTNAKGKWFGDTSGWYAKDCTLMINDVSYTFDANGYMQ